MAKVAMVTGAGQGIGFAVARELAEAGFSVAVCELNEETGKASANELNKKTDSRFFKTDVTSFSDVKATVSDIEQELGPVEVLVNTVGWDIIEPFIENDESYWEKIIDINFKSALYGSRAVLSQMIERSSGRIINIGSDAGRVGSMGETVYAGAKGGD
ncbi:3-oxoacyl-[acyl-carrier protein] reductase [Geomicrobium sp. JCM 19037]|nr:3-oxoacyl-[acyl-carrier protein] reductase [Geomicrobium sp. JCM 19037]